ncbi:MAG: class I SAM-dependent methyltransferase [Bacteroidales bacterium]
MYNAEKYWSDLALQINSRNGMNLIAGDDEPYYRYKRSKFIEMLRKSFFTGKKVLEIGCGPGGNLIEILKDNPLELNAVDISEQMVLLAKQNLASFPVKIIKTNGTVLPYQDQSMDIVLTVTVLQHNTHPEILQSLVAEICRVANEEIIIFERLESKIIGNESCQGRPVEFYRELFVKYGFELTSLNFLPISCSYYFCGAIRKIFGMRNRKEGELHNRAVVILQNIILPITRLVDIIWIEKRDLAKMVFRKIRSSPVV